MLKKIITATALAAVVVTGTIPAMAKPYYEWSTKYPFSGFQGGYGKGSYYCDYIRYPKRVCDYKRVCHHGHCYEKPICRTVGWDVRQSCY